MTELVLIRHGQARFGTADYDRLSGVGERQARLTGRHLAARAASSPDVLLAGDMRRQQRTARLAIQGFADPPPLRVAPAFNEYDAQALFTAYLPRVLAHDPALAQHRQALFSDKRVFQRAFERVTAHWLAAAPTDVAACEPWADFSGRVATALARLRADYPREATIGVFTSGGPIAVAVAEATGASAAKTIELNFGIYNGAVTRLRATRSGWRLAGFNDIAALRAAGDPALITYR